MFDTIKLGLLTWGALSLIIFAFVILLLWVTCSVWWIITNTMLDRTTFIILSTSISLGISTIMLVTSLLSKEK
jgi:hypothetical protein